jgi:hypothetical protein
MAHELRIRQNVPRYVVQGLIISEVLDERDINHTAKETDMNGGDNSGFGSRYGGKGKKTQRKSAHPRNPT